jgi:hypothetical protein
MSGRTWTVEQRLEARSLYFVGPIDPTKIKRILVPIRVDLRIQRLAFYELVRADPVPGKEVISKRELPFGELLREGEAA